MKIQLDTNAMNSLFPEGSESRVELQNAVIANFATKMKDKFINENVIKIVEGVIGTAPTQLQVEQMVSEYINTQFSQTGTYWNKSFAIKKQGELAKSIDSYIKTLIHSYDSDLKRISRSYLTAEIDAAKVKFEQHLKTLFDAELNKAQDTMIQLVQENMSEIIRSELQRVISSKSHLPQGNDNNMLL